MRKIDKIIIHSSATSPSMDIGVNEIDIWHKQRIPPFRCIGYHYVIRRDGTLEYGRPISEIGAHTRGHNKGSIGICWIGGVSETLEAEDNRTAEQKWKLVRLVESLEMVFADLDIVGHNDLANTNCPSFNVKEEYGMD